LGEKKAENLAWTYDLSETNHVIDALNSIALKKAKSKWTWKHQATLERARVYGLFGSDQVVLLGPEKEELPEDLRELKAEPKYLRVLREELRRRGGVPTVVNEWKNRIEKRVGELEKKKSAENKYLMLCNEEWLRRNKGNVGAPEPTAAEIERKKSQDEIDNEAARQAKVREWWSAKPQQDEYGWKQSPIRSRAHLRELGRPKHVAVKASDDYVRAKRSSWTVNRARERGSKEGAKQFREGTG